MVENTPNGEPQQERSPFYDDRLLQGEAQGNLESPNPELLDLLVQRDEMHEKSREKGGAAQLSEDEQEKARELSRQIREKKRALGFDPYG